MHARDVRRRAFPRATERERESIKGGPHRGARYLERIQCDAVQLSRECQEGLVALHPYASDDVGGAASDSVVNRERAVEELALVRIAQRGGGTAEAERWRVRRRSGRFGAQSSDTHGINRSMRVT